MKEKCNGALIYPKFVKIPEYALVVESLQKERESEESK